MLAAPLREGADPAVQRAPRTRLEEWFTVDSGRSSPTSAHTGQLVATDVLEARPRQMRAIKLRAGSQLELAQAEMIIRPAAERPAEQGLHLADRKVVDAGDAPAHQSMGEAKRSRAGLLRCR